MYYVNLYKNRHRFVHAPFESKDKAIHYFNLRCDLINNNWLKADYLEITDGENIILFDYEV